YQNVIRLGGYDQYETSAKIARYLKDNNLAAPGKAVIAYGENFPDALAVSSLAAYQHSPILLTRTHSLPSYTEDALKELQISESTVVGGTAVIGPEVSAQLPSMKRYSGMDKYETAIAIAQGMNADLNTVFIATGENFPDALAGSVLAARTNSPIILVNKNLPASANTFLATNMSQIKETMVLGGIGVVPDTVLETISKTLEPTQPSNFTPLPSPPPSAPPTPPHYVPLVTAPQILGTPVNNAQGLTENTMWFDTLRDGGIFPKQDLTIKWSGAPTPMNYLIRVQSSTANSDTRIVFWAFVGNVGSYTLPASIFTEGNDYRISVAATTGTNRFAPDYKEWYVNGGFYPSMGVLITIHTLQPAAFISPANGDSVPKEDLIIKWNAPDWKNIDGQYEVYSSVRIIDLTNVLSGPPVLAPQPNWGSYILDGSALSTGHTYRFIVDEWLPGNIPGNHQTSETTFTVR
ncbi:MAG: cell wall-binding repeat-containing protein, partial [Bacillota bacterium]|nr:cell wall-binding repeat-containing protein [Bacillota bacterium]